MSEDEPVGTFPVGGRPARMHGENGLNNQTQRRIGNHLRALYDSVVQQPIPDRFRDLIARLDDTPPLADDDAQL